jgi:hypothetical protein
MYRVYVPSTPPVDQVLGSAVTPGGSETPTSSHWGTEFTGGDLPLSENARSLHQRTESFRSERSQSLFSEASSLENVMGTGSHSKRQLLVGGDSPMSRTEVGKLNPRITLTVWNLLPGPLDGWIPSLCSVPVRKRVLLILYIPWPAGLKC